MRTVADDFPLFYFKKRMTRHEERNEEKNYYNTRTEKEIEKEMGQPRLAVPFRMVGYFKFPIKVARDSS